jgi:hypothetical protein
MPFTAMPMGEEAGASQAKTLEGDYKRWLCAMLPKHFRGLDQFAPHHEDFWSWAWGIEKGKTLDPPACLYIANRGGAKSTQSEGFLVASAAKKVRKYALCVTRTQAQADKHVRTINSMLLASNIGKSYPELAKPLLRKVGSKDVQSAWNREMLTTDSGWTVQGFGLLSAERGIRVEEFRPDLIWITDIDEENDSVGMVDSLLAALAGSILGTQSSDCVFIFDQNLIHRDSVANRIYTRKTDVLSVRKIIGGSAIPAIYNADYERRDERWYITKGKESWKQGLPIPVCENILNVVGKTFWEREYQNNINLPYEDAVYGMWRESHHIITWSEFARGFIKAGCPSEWFFDRKGQVRLPERGKIVMAQDWGNNSKHPCANRWVWTPAEIMKLQRFVFFYREMCFPRFPAVDDDTRIHPSAIKVGEAIHEVEKEWNEASRMQWRLASHERPEIVEAYLTDMPKAGLKPLYFDGIDTANARSGILHMQNFLQIEPDQLHPFSVYPSNHPQAGMPLAGCPKAFFIVADGQGELLWDENLSILSRAPAKDEAGQARTRFEYPNFRKPDTAEGAERRDSPKINDDVVDTDRAIAGMLFPTIEKFTFDERIESMIPEKHRLENIVNLPDAESEAVTMGRYYAVATARHELEKKAVESMGFRQRGKFKHSTRRRF